MDTLANDSPPISRGARLREVAIVFTKLGFTAFGGPMAHLALMENEIVTRRKWCSRQTFLDLTAAVNFIPGPNSTEMAIHLGYLRAGFFGLLAAGVCFVTPAVLIILPIAFVYVRYNTLPQVQPVLHSIAAAIVAIILVAAIRLARSTLNNAFSISIAVMTLLLWILGTTGVRPVAAVFHAVQPEIALLALAAIVGIVWKAKPQSGQLALFPLAKVYPVTDLLPFDQHWVQMGFFFLKVGATLFGSGYVLASFLQTGLVEQYGWISTRELNDAIAVGQFTPGPLLTTATFIGYVLGHRTFSGGDAGGVFGACLATIAIFLPSFFFVLILAPVMDRLRKNPVARAALDAMNAAVVMLIGVTLLRLGADAFVGVSGGVDVINVTIGAIGFGLMLVFDVNATWLVLGAIGIGSVRSAAVAL